MANHQSEGSSGFVGGLIAGMALGAVTGLFVAPQTGQKTRRRLRQAIDAAPDLAADLSADLSHVAATDAARVRQISRTALTELDQTLGQVLSRVKVAIAAGIEASRQDLTDSSTPEPDAPGSNEAARPNPAEAENGSYGTGIPSSVSE